MSNTKIKLNFFGISIFGTSIYDTKRIFFFKLIQSISVKIVEPLLIPMYKDESSKAENIL